MNAPITITVAGADDFAADIIAHAVGDLLRKHGVNQPVGVNCGANPLDFDLSSYAVNVVRVAPAPTAATFGVTGPPVSEMPAEIRSRVIAMGIEPRRVRGLYVHPSSGLLKVRHRPLYMREAVLSEETAEEYAAWQAVNSKAKPEADPMPPVGPLTSTVNLKPGDIIRVIGSAIAGSKGDPLSVSSVSDCGEYVRTTRPYNGDAFGCLAFVARPGTWMPYTGSKNPAPGLDVRVKEVSGIEFAPLGGMQWDNARRCMNRQIVAFMVAPGVVESRTPPPCPPDPRGEDADLRRSPNRQDLTVRELQTALPWTVRYSADFRANPQSHKDFAHALLHIQKASGALAAFVDDMDHRRETADEADTQERYGNYLADMVVCALRLANTFPGGVLDLQRAVEDRLESKNSVTLPRPVA